MSDSVLFADNNNPSIKSAIIQYMTNKSSKSSVWDAQNRIFVFFFFFYYFCLVNIFMQVICFIIFTVYFCFIFTLTKFVCLPKPKHFITIYLLYLWSVLTCTLSVGRFAVHQPNLNTCLCSYLTSHRLCRLCFNVEPGVAACRLGPC